MIFDEINAAIELGERVASLYEKLKERGRQSGELTPEQEQAADAAFAAKVSQRRWRTDAELETDRA